MQILATPIESVGAGSARWQVELRQAVRDPYELCRRLRLPEKLAEQAAVAGGWFPLLVPPAYLARIEPGNPADPLLRQVLPLACELDEAAGFGTDPVGEAQCQRHSGLLQKYSGRALLVTTGACAIHCRYCFRRHYPYETARPWIDRWRQALDSLRNSDCPDAAWGQPVRELILSGGDPLTLTDAALSQLLVMADAVAELQRLRIHTRLPVVIPSRVTDRLIELLAGSRLSMWVVLHVNHPREIDADVAAAIARLRAIPATVLNQAVLLRGVNDELETLRQLCEDLANLGVMPYYLHQLDPVAGAAHFEVDDRRAIELVNQLRERLPGYAVPRLARELAGSASKTVLA